jgi:Flp pilus assembly protein TadD
MTVTKITLGLLLAAGLAACADPQPRARAEPQPPTGTLAPAPAVEPAATLPELLKQIETAYRRGNYAAGLALVKRALELEKNDVSAMDRIGSIYYVLGRYGEAVTIWGKALPLEQDLQKRRALENSIAVARRSLGLVDGAPAAPPVAALPPKKTAPRKKAGPKEIAALQKKGIKYYAAGEYLQATTVFLRILDLDPGNADATKALKRLRLGP